MLTKIITIFSNQQFLILLILILLLLVFIQTVRLHADRKKLRSDAIKRSRAVIGGQVVEQVAPFLPNFPCSPSDAHFIGKPIDFLAFSGLSDHNCVDEILFIEVKTGLSTLSNREKEVKKAVEEGRVRYVEYRV